MKMISKAFIIASHTLLGCVLITNGFHIHPSSVLVQKSAPTSLWTNTPKRNEISTMSASPTETTPEENDKNYEDSSTDKAKNTHVDSIHRRQILLSMLTSAGVSASTISNAWATVVSPETAGIGEESTIQPPSIATSLRGDGNTKLIIPPMDDRVYETMTLENGLRVLLCSDLSSFTAAAAMDVHVGAASDPDSIPGLAHFCEVSE